MNDNVILNGTYALERQARGLSSSSQAQNHLQLRNYYLNTHQYQRAVWLQRLASLALLMGILLLSIPNAVAQVNVGATPCGVVNTIDFPFQEVGPNVWYPRFRFGYLRPDWGYHAGEDWFLASGRSYGQPVSAIADGLVTYAALTGWGVDKGVVIIEHVMPSGARVYSIYGHLEELNDHEFPTPGTCVERGQIIGAIGRPSSSPHLHFEIRHMWDDTPGPGYWSVDPSTSGWENPSAFIMNWGGYLNPAYEWHITLPDSMTADPAIGPDGTIFVAGEGFLETHDSEGWLLTRQEIPEEWRVIALIPNPAGDGAHALTRSGELIRLDGELAFDSDDVMNLEGEFDGALSIGNAVFVHTRDLTLRLYDRAFSLRGEWSGMRLPHDGVGTESLYALAIGPLRPEVMFFSSEGRLLQRATLRDLASLAAAPDGGVFVRTHHALWHVSPTIDWTFLTEDFPIYSAGRALGSDSAGGTYLYSGAPGEEDGLLYAFGSDGALRREIQLPHRVVNPTMTVGDGCAAYLASSEGYLIGIRTDTGEVGNPLTSYPGTLGGGRPWVVVRPDETVLFALGDSQIIAVDGRLLAGLSSGSACEPPP